jgi:hypothetical protein
MSFKSFILVALLLLLPGIAAAQDLVLPSEPDPRALARAIGVPRGNIAMFNTTVVRLDSGTFHVLYGFIFGNMKRDGIIHVANDVDGLVCQGKTTRQPDRSGKGEISCLQNGKLVGISPVDIATGVYGKFNGIDSGVVLDPNGKQIGTVITQWHASAFPDAAKIVAMWK